MSADNHRRRLSAKREKKAAAEKKAREYRAKESAKRAAAAKAREAAAKTSSATTQRSKLRDAERYEREAATAGAEAAKWDKRATGYAKDEVTIGKELTRAETAETKAADKARQRDVKRVEQRAAAERAELETRIHETEETVTEAIHQLREPKPEKLRILLLGASAEGDLRVGREQARIRKAVEAALHRDYVDFDARPAATTADLLDGITKFRPHVVHFSGHSNSTLIAFEDDLDEVHESVVVTARAFASAIQATDDPPLLVLLNSCNSADQIDDLVDKLVPFAIGMSDTIADADAINYAAQFYAAIANGQSVGSAHLSGRAALELAGLDGADLPTLAWAVDVDPTRAILVRFES